MKKIHLLAIVITASALAVWLGFKFSQSDKRDEGFIKPSTFSRIQEIIIDSCEYIVAEKVMSDAGICIIHKANCKNH